MSPVLLRSALPEELPALGTLELRAAERFRHSAHPYAVDLPAFDPGVLGELTRAGNVWVAFTPPNELLGFAVGGTLGPHAYLHELDVAPEHGRRGVGRALIRKVAESAEAAGHTRLLLSTFSDVPWNAPYYARLGFEVIPLDDYDDAMREQRRRDGAAGLVIQSRVIMAAALSRLLEH
jgi:ribosomal protein S18 acetylase RimI-like enzyme